MLVSSLKDICARRVLKSIHSKLLLDFAPGKGRTRIVGNLINVLFSLERHLVQTPWRFTGIVPTKKSDKCIEAAALVDTAGELTLTPEKLSSEIYTRNIPYTGNILQSTSFNSSPLDKWT